MKNLNELKKQIELFNTIRLNSLKRSNLGADYSFESIFPEIETTYKELKKLSLEVDILENSHFVSQNNINQLKDVLERFYKTANKILEFVPTTGGDPNPRKEALVNEIGAFSSDIANNLQQLMVVIKTEKFDAKQYQVDLDKETEQIRLLVQDLNKKKEEGKAALQSIQDASSSSGSVIFSDIFKSQAIKHSKGSKRWFQASIILFIILLDYLVLLFFYSNGLPDTETTASIIKDSVLRILTLGVLTLALTQSIKNFNTNKHLQVVNEHRQNALSTFNIFTSSTSDPEVKSAVLLQATKAIFETGQTGYLSKESKTNYSLNISDVFKKFNSSD